MSRHENSNQFNDGLLMDLHPLQTPNTVLTDCLNGTFITYNGNEYSLQNDMGNFKLKNCRLKPKYFPIGTTSYADTIYIVSYNPVDKRVEVGSYPAPVEYNETSTDSKKKFWTISEAYIRQLNDTAGTDSDFKFEEDLSVLNEYKKTLMFSGDEFRLKSGDKFRIEYDELIKCGFEELEQTIIFDSGKTQKVNLDYNTSSFSDVSWNTPGNIQLSSRIFEIEKIDHHVANLYYGLDHCRLDLAVDLLISDKSLIEKIKSSPDILDSVLDSDRIWLKYSAYNNGNLVWPSDSPVSDAVATKESDSPVTIIPKAEIVTKKISPWLDEFLKVTFIVAFYMNYDYAKGEDGNYSKDEEGEFITEKRKWTFDFQPAFHTNITFSSQQNKEIIKYEGDIFHDQLKFTFEHIVDPSNNPYKNIGDRIFKWQKGDSNWSIKANGTELSDGKMFYAIYSVPLNPVDEDGKSGIDNYSFVDLNWKLTEYDKSEYCYQIDEGLEDNQFYIIYYKGVPFTNISQLKWVGDEDPDPNFYKVWHVDESTYACPNDLWQHIELYAGNDKCDPDHINSAPEELTQYIDKRLLQENSNVTVKPMITCDPPITAEERYDNIPFSEFVKKAYSDGLTYNLGNNGTLSTTIYTHDDIKNADENYEVPDALSSRFYKYFKRYSDNTIDFKSFVELKDAPSGTATFNVYKNNDISDIQVESDTTPDGIFSDYENDVEYDDSFKKLLIGTGNTKIKVWTDVLGSVSVGDSFLFTDHLKYYRIKFRDARENHNQQFEAFNIDQNGRGDCTTNILMPPWGTKGLQWVTHKSLDINNYTAVRMHYPGCDHWGKYWENGMSQMDFANYDSSQMWSWIGGTGNIAGTIVGVTVGATTALTAGAGAIVGAISMGAIAGGIAGIVQQFKSPKYIPGMCQYISNMHKSVRKDLDDDWNKNKPQPVLNATLKNAGECSINGNQAAEIRLHSRTTYRVKAERVAFRNDSGSVDIRPDWGKWANDARRPEGQGGNDQKGVSANATFIAFPVLEKMCHSLDREKWWRVSSCEQHNDPEWLAFNIPMDGIGLSGANGGVYHNDKSDGQLNLYACWIPGKENENKTFTRYARSSVNFGSLGTTGTTGKHSDTKCLILKPVRKIPNNIRGLGDLIKATIPDIKGAILDTNIKYVVSGIDNNPVDNQKVEINLVDLDNLKNTINNQILADDNGAKEHPIFKMVMIPNPPDRLENHPVNGVYPVRTIDQLNANPNVFKPNTGFFAYKNFYVDHEGRVFLTNLSASNDIYVTTNSGRKVFGYFPYLNDCNGWI